MNTLTIQVENQSVMDKLREVLKTMSGVVILPSRKKMTGMEEAMEDVRNGRVTEYSSAEDMFEKLGKS